jgi:hypothetical protein
VVRVSVVEPTALDFDEHADLLNRCFQSVLAGSGTENTLSPAFFRWKYHGPIGDAKIARVHDDGRLIAANSMFALNIVWKGQRVRAWQSCDTATDPIARGKGYYVTCLKALQEQLGPDVIFFGFPNHNSGRGFLSSGCFERHLMTAWMRPLPAWLLPGRREVDRITRFDDDAAAMFAEAAVGRPPMVERTAGYLNWRYLQHPLANYEAFGLRRGGHLSGVIVLRSVRSFGQDLALVMDFMGLDTTAEVALLRFASRWAAARGLWPVVAFSTLLGARHAVRTAFLPVPSKFLRKRQVLMGKATGEASGRMLREKWLLNLGDWDGF